MAADAAEPAGPPDDLTDARGRGPAADRARPHQRRDRATAVPQRAHGRVPPRAHPAEDAALHARRARALRARPRARRRRRPQRPAAAGSTRRGRRPTRAKLDPDARAGVAGDDRAACRRPARRARACPTRPKPSRGLGGVEAARRRRRLSTSIDRRPVHDLIATRSARGVLGDVRQRLLDEPVDAVSSSGRAAAPRRVAELDVGLDLEPLDAATRSRERLDRRRQAELVERGRAQLGDQRAQVRDLGGRSARPRRRGLLQAASASPRRSAADEQHLSAASPCSVSSCSSRAQRRRSCSADRMRAAQPLVLDATARSRRRSPRSRRTPAAAARRRR